MRREVDLETRIGSVTLASPVMTAAGTAGHGAELAAHVDLGAIGAVVVKSLSAEPWDGNPAPRVVDVAAGMLNSVGLQNPGVQHWLQHELPGLVATGARVVASIWGSSVGSYASAAGALAEAPAAVVAVEVNLSCPNLEGGRHQFAHSASATADAVRASLVCGRPVWAKLGPAVADVPAIAAAAAEAGAEAVTLINTVPGMAIDVETRHPRLGAGSGGLSGPAIHPVAVRAVHECHRAHRDLPIVGVGGVCRGVDAVELLLAGAAAVQVGSATFAEPRAVARIQDELQRWCKRHGVTHVRDLIGGAHV